MYDQETQSRWSQLFGEAVSGPMKGQNLKKLPSTMTTWKRWKALHPDTTVYVKPSIPYGSRRWRFNAEVLEKLAKKEPGPLERKDLVVGVEGHVTAKAYPLQRLAGPRVVNDTLEETPIAVFLSDDFTTARVFTRTVADQTLKFRLDDAQNIVDEQTGSTWDLMSGKATSGPLKDKVLQEIVNTYSLWFAWQKYRPDTLIFGE